VELVDRDLVLPVLDVPDLEVCCQPVQKPLDQS